LFFSQDGLVEIRPKNSIILTQFGQDDRGEVMMIIIADISWG
jgi:hypothetical protein